MIEVMHNLFVGGAADLVHVDDGNGGVKGGWYVITAARDPWHRQALGYTTRGAPKDDPEYLIAMRPNRMLLNLVDAADPAFIRDEIIDAAQAAIDVALAEGKRVLVHCNEGKSRAPTIAMLWMFRHEAKHGMLPVGAADPIADMLRSWMRIYPDYAPADGMRLYAQHWLEKMTKAA